MTGSPLTLAFGDPQRLPRVFDVPTLVIDAERSPVVVRQAAQSLADALPIGHYRTLPGQGHDLVPEAIGPVVQEFLLAQHTEPAF